MIILNKGDNITSLYNIKLIIPGGFKLNIKKGEILIIKENKNNSNYVIEKKKHKSNKYITIFEMSTHNVLLYFDYKLLLKCNRVLKLKKLNSINE